MIWVLAFILSIHSLIVSNHWLPITHSFRSIIYSLRSNINSPPPIIYRFIHWFTHSFTLWLGLHPQRQLWCSEQVQLSHSDAPFLIFSFLAYPSLSFISFRFNSHEIFSCSTWSWVNIVADISLKWLIIFHTRRVNFNEITSKSLSVGQTVYTFGCIGIKHVFSST